MRIRRATRYEPAAIQGAPFSQTLAITGGVAPHTCQLETGSFPAGINVSSACVVSGTTAAAPGNYPVVIRVTDASTGPGSYFEAENYTLTVSPPPSVRIEVAPASVSEDGGTMKIEVGGVTQPAPAPRFSRSTPARPVAPVPGVTDEGALAEWGFSPAAIEALKAAGAI